MQTLTLKYREMLGIPGLRHGTFLEEGYIEAASILRLELFKIEQDYEKTGNLPKEFLPMVTRLQAIHSALGIHKNQQSPAKSEEKEDIEFDFSKVA